MRSWFRRHIVFDGGVVWWVWGIGIEVPVTLSDVTIIVSIGPFYGSASYVW